MVMKKNKNEIVLACLAHSWSTEDKIPTFNFSFLFSRCCESRKVVELKAEKATEKEQLKMSAKK